MNLQKSSVTVLLSITGDTNTAYSIHTQANQEQVSIRNYKTFSKHICHAGKVGLCLLLIYSFFFLGASFIKVAYAFMIQEVQYAEIN